MFDLLDILKQGEIGRIFGDLMVIEAWHHKEIVKKLVLDPKTLQHITKSVDNFKVLDAIESIIDLECCQNTNLCDTLQILLDTRSNDQITTKCQKLMLIMASISPPALNLNKLIHYYYESGNPKMIELLTILFKQVESPKLDVESFTELMAKLIRHDSQEASELYEMLVFD